VPNRKPQNRRKPAKPKSGDATGDAKRQGNGQFGPGNNANPGGRPKLVREVQEFASTFSFEAVDRLVQIMRGRSVKEARQAAVAILDRAGGKPAQPIGGVPGNPIGVQAGAGVIEMLRKLAGETAAE
jgi:hypothetical protein